MTDLEKLDAAIKRTREIVHDYWIEDATKDGNALADVADAAQAHADRLRDTGTLEEALFGTPPEGDFNQFTPPATEKDEK